MKQGWEYKKLGEVCDIYQPRTLSTDMLTNTGNYPVYGANGIIGYYNQYNHKDQEVLLTCRGATCGTINISEPYSWINGNAMVIHRKSEEMLFKYLKYLMLSLDYSFIITGAAQPQITRQKLAPTKIGIPPKSTQLAIVSELDKINELICLKKEQLKDFDNLAQSIFYEMFGDPVENEMGWEVKKLVEVSSLINGRAYKQNELLNEGKYKVLRVGNFFTNSNYYYSNLELDDEKYCYKGDLLFAWSASFGAFIWDEGKTIFHYHIWRVLFDEKNLNIYYYKYLLNTMTNFFMNDVHGIGMVHLTKAGMEQYNLPLPPLPLQHLFAHRIEQIEHQKAEVQKAITDLKPCLPLVCSIGLNERAQALMGATRPASDYFSAASSR